MLTPISGHLHVGVDIGSRRHAVAIGLSDGRRLAPEDLVNALAPGLIDTPMPTAFLPQTASAC